MICSPGAVGFHEGGVSASARKTLDINIPKNAADALSQAQAGRPTIFVQCHVGRESFPPLSRCSDQTRFVPEKQGIGQQVPTRT